MKKSEIRVGGHYWAKVSGNLVTVRVGRIRESESFGMKTRTIQLYDVTIISTGRKATFRSAARFREEVKEKLPVPPNCSCPAHRPADPEDTRYVRHTPECQKRHSEWEASPAAAAVPPAAPPVSSLASLLRKTASSAGATAEDEDTAPHLIVEARAGTGKTTTLVEGLRLLRGEASKLTPSPQQKAVWDAICLSKGKAKTICFVAFNKSIATELQARVPKGCDAMTMHSMGFRAVTKALGRQEPNSYVVQDYIAEILGKDIRELRKTKAVVLKTTEDLVGLCKQNLTHTDPLSQDRDWEEELAELANHYGIDLNGSREEVFALVPQVLERCKSPQGKISFDDMIWLPVVLCLPVFRYDLLLIDEAQDLNRCQQALAKKAGKRLVLCGDPKQAIYGFAGADSESMKRMERELSEVKHSFELDGDGSPGTVKYDGRQGRGCMTLHLTVTRRCGKAIVAEARRYVPDFSAHESNPEGIVRRSSLKAVDLTGYRFQVADGDMVLCRTNAPLVSECFRFIRAGRKANIQGRDIGAGLISTVRKLCKDDAATATELVGVVSTWVTAEVAKENAKVNPSESRITGLQDRADCMICFTEGAATVVDVISKIEKVFTDDKTSLGIRLSSIHKAKGLEARRVFFLRPEKAGPNTVKMQPWELDQEDNLAYVAMTRAIEELVYVC
jgi:hypothetical protein